MKEPFSQHPPDLPAIECRVAICIVLINASRFRNARKENFFLLVDSKFYFSTRNSTVFFKGNSNNVFFMHQNSVAVYLYNRLLNEYIKAAQRCPRNKYFPFFPIPLLHTLYMPLRLHIIVQYSFSTCSSSGQSLSSTAVLFGHASTVSSLPLPPLLFPFHTISNVHHPFANTESSKTA